MSVSKKSSGYFFEYHGGDPGGGHYYGGLLPPYRPEISNSSPAAGGGGGGGHLQPRVAKAKKSFASRLANQIDRLTGGGTLRDANKHLHHSSFGGGSGRVSLHEAFAAAGGAAGCAAKPAPPRRAFRNVVPGRAGVFVKNYCPPWEAASSPVTLRQHFVHPAHCADLCEPEWPLELRRAQSDESVHASFNDNARRNNGSSAKWYDEDEHDLAYAEVDYIYSCGGRRPPPPRGVLLQQHRQRQQQMSAMMMNRPQQSRSSSRGALEQGEVRMINQSQALVTSPSSTLQGRSSKRSLDYSARQRRESASPRPSAVNAGTIRLTVPDGFGTLRSSPRSAGSSGRVTVNGHHRGGSRNNSSIIYLTPEGSNPLTTSGTSGVTVSTRRDQSGPARLATTIEVRMDGRSSGGSSGPFTTEEEESSVDENDDSESESTTSHKDSSASDTGEDKALLESKSHARREKQEQDAIDELEKVIDLESEDDAESDDYDADCSQLESPRKVKDVATSLPDNPVLSSPRKRVSNLSQESIPEEDEQHDFPGSFRPQKRSSSLDSRSSNVGERRLNKSRLGRLLMEHQEISKSDQLRERSRQRRKSREEQESEIAADDEAAISRGFSREILKEVYGSKTSLLRQLTTSAPSGSDDTITNVSSLSMEKSAATSAKPPRDKKSSRRHSTTFIGGSGEASQTSILISSSNKTTPGQKPYMFQDTTRLRMLLPRPSIARDTFNLKIDEEDAENVARVEIVAKGAQQQLGRKGISQSFKERIVSPVRPKEPPPPPPSPPPPQQPPQPPSPDNQAAAVGGGSRRLPPTPKKEPTAVYDIAEFDESAASKGNRTVPLKSRLLPAGGLFFGGGGATGSLKKLRGRVAAEKPPRATAAAAKSAERSRSFGPRTAPTVNQSSAAARLFQRSLSHMPKSFSYNSLERGTVRPRNVVVSSANSVCGHPGGDAAINASSSSNLATLVSSSINSSFENDRRPFKDFKKILSSPAVSSPTSTLSSKTSKKKNKKSKKKNNTESSEHIYEEIPATSDPRKRPLPPLPVEHTPTALVKQNAVNEMEPPPSSPKSIFEGATKYDILHYLEDAKERGFTDDDDDDDAIAIDDRNSANRVSNMSSSGGSSDGSSNNNKAMNGNCWTSVEIERNDSGLGSETGVKRPLRVRSQGELRQGNTSSNRAASSRQQQVVRRGASVGGHLNLQHICEDCDQNITEANSHKDCEINYDPMSSPPTCLPCARRRAERKEIIAEIVETEDKYGRDLGIIRDEFRAPMQVAGLLDRDQLAQVFLNVDDLWEASRRLTAALRDAIELAMDDGDEELCSVAIGAVFLAVEDGMLQAFTSYCTRQANASSLLASLEKEKELLRIFLRVSQMENTILRRMNLSSFLMVPVQRVTKYPLLLSRLLKVTPAGHRDRVALQQSRQRVEHHLEQLNADSAAAAAAAAAAGRDSNNAARLWRRISMINVAGTKKIAMDGAGQLDVLGNTTWGIRKMALDVLNWGSEHHREEVNFVLESRLLCYSNNNATNGGGGGNGGGEATSGWTVKMTPVNALLTTLGNNGSSFQGDGSVATHAQLQFPKETGVRQAAVIMIKEKGGRYTMVRDPLYLDKCIICWEQDWEDCFEVQDFVAKESYIFKAEDIFKTRQWFRALQFYGLGLGQWRRRRNALANIMINGMGRKD